MNTSQISEIDNEFTLMLLKALGRRKPTPKQVELANQLFSTVTIRQQILFNKLLTRAERRCLLLSAKGFKTSGIANLLNTKTSTIQTHRKNILRKLSCGTSEQAVFSGIQLGYITPTID
jgi:DNA-binding CsgD family transcriptional regulator